MTQAISPVVKNDSITHLYGVELSPPVRLYRGQDVSSASSLYEVWGVSPDTACDISEALRIGAVLSLRQVDTVRKATEDIRPYLDRVEAEFKVAMSLPDKPVYWTFNEVGDLVTHIHGKMLRNPWVVTHISDARRARTLFDLYLEIRPSWVQVFGDLKALFPSLEQPKGADVPDIVEAVDEALRAMTPKEEVPTTPSEDPKDYKLDNGKLDYTLLMHDMAPAVRQVVNCLHWGHYTKGYPRNGYKTLPGGTDRLVAACYRHMAAMAGDFHALDEESGLPHAIHAVTNLLMALSQEKAQ